MTADSWEAPPEDGKKSCLQLLEKQARFCPGFTSFQLEDPNVADHEKFRQFSIKHGEQVVLELYLSKIRTLQNDSLLAENQGYH